MAVGRVYGGVSAEERTAQRRERLLAAGLELFGTRGYAATGVKDVCGEAGLTDRYFYESFRDSRELFLAVFDGVTDELFATVARAVVDAGGDPEAQLRAAIGAFIAALADDPRRARVVFSESVAVGPEAQQHVRTTLRRFSALVAATARTHLPPDVPEGIVGVLGLSLVGAMERIVVEWQDGELAEPLDAVVEHCAQLYLRLLPR